MRFVKVSVNISKNNLHISDSMAKKLSLLNVNFIGTYNLNVCMYLYEMKKTLPIKEKGDSNMYDIRLQVLATFVFV